MDDRFNEREEPWRVIIADDEVEVRSALRLLFEQHAGRGIELGEATNVADLLTAMSRIAPHLLMLDWEMPGVFARGGGGPAHSTGLVTQLRGISPHTRIVTLSANPDRKPQAVAACVDAFVSKNESADRLLPTLLAC